MKQEAGNEGRRPLTGPLQGETHEYPTLGRTGIEGGDVPLDDERPAGL